MSGDTLRVGRSAVVRGPVEAEADRVLAQCVGDTARFVEDVWCRRPMLARAVDPAGFADIVSPEEVDDLLSTRGLRGDQLRVVSEGRAVSVRNFTGWGSIGNSPVKEVLKPANVLMELAGGATLVIDDVSEFSPGASRAARSVGRALGCPAQASLYITSAGRRGLAPHQDEEHVLVLQLRGRKRWVVGDESAGEDVVQAVLKPGDCLYVPAHTTHAAESLPEAMSVHLTIGLTVPTVADAIRQLVADRSEGGFGLETPVRGAEALRADLLATLAALTETVEQTAASEVLDEVRAPMLVGTSLPVPIDVAAHLPHLDGASVLRLTPFGVVRVRRVSEDEAEVSGGARRLRIPWTAAARLLAIDPARFCLGEVLGGNAPTAAGTLSRLLVAEGVAEPVEEEDR